MNLWERFSRTIHTLYKEPWHLRGAGSRHEASFERLLQAHGIFSCRPLKIPMIGYERHPNGPQRWPDFHLQDERTLLPVELKTTSRTSVHIGKTWIKSDALYIISHRPSDSVFISWGKDMKTEEEDRQFREFQHHVRSVRPYRMFRSTVEWSASVHVQYRLEERQRRLHFERVIEGLKPLTRR